jgi:DNA-binding LacI/PurR family transcriptional regulator
VLKESGCFFEDRFQGTVSETDEQHPFHVFMFHVFPSQPHTAKFFNPIPQKLSNFFLDFDHSVRVICTGQSLIFPFASIGSPFMVSQKVVHQLTQLIESGQAAVGSYLPSTRELASRFNVSQYTVGAALKTLEGMRLVECLPRQGAVVRARTPQSLEPSRKQVILYMHAELDWRKEAAEHYSWGGRITTYIEKELFEGGVSMVMTPSQTLSEDGPTHGQRLDLLGSAVSGVIAFARTGGAVELIEQSKRRGLPWLLINRPSRNLVHNYITADNQGGGRRVGRLFAEMGFKRLLLLDMDPTQSLSDSEKLTGVFQGYLESGAPVDGIRAIHCGDVYESHGYQATRSVLAGGFRPQGVFAAGDLLALGAIRALREAGMRVPEDVAVIGGTGWPTSDQFDPPLSVLAQPMEEIGRTAAQLLMEMIREGTRKYAPRRIPCELILRQSTKIPDSVKIALEPESKRADTENEIALEIESG